MQCRRYSPVIADLKFVLNIEGVSARFAATCLDTWGEVLRMMHYIHGQVRQPASRPPSGPSHTLTRASTRTNPWLAGWLGDVVVQERQRGLHVEHELRDWMFAFNVQVGQSGLCHDKPQSRSKHEGGRAACL